MSNQVKYFDTAFHSGFTLGACNVAGALLTPFDLALYAGFNQVNVSSITRSGTVATVTTSTSHNYLHGQVILIAGANETDYNGEFVITVTSATTFTYTVANSPATPATGTITAKVAPLGWSKPYSGTNKAVYQSANTGSSQHYFRLDDSAATLTWDRNTYGQAVTHAGTYAMRCGIFTAMSDVDTGTEVGKTMFLRGVATSGNRLIIVGDDTTMYYAIYYAGAYTWFGYGGFGDYLPWNGATGFKPSFAMGAWGSQSANAPIYTYDNPLANHGVHSYILTQGGNYPPNGLALGMASCMTRGEASQGSQATPHVHAWRVGGFTGTLGSTGLQEMGTFSAVQGNTLVTNWFQPIYIGYLWPLPQIFGEMPGLIDQGVTWTTRMVTSSADPFHISPIIKYRAPNGSIRKLLTFHTGGSERRGTVGIDITGPWR
jgi:hypothetical protein